MLLDDAELEYGYHSEGPLLLPCDVDLFCGIIAEIGGDEHVSGFVNGPFNPARRLGKATDMAKGCASYAAALALLKENIPVTGHFCVVYVVAV
ncbi:hypothetical protein SASPL_152383 [Salvia splendens]|uniref:SAUR family protein n=1 Tax=Salvia splendens TaxID=180675 RepID=A0A8X8Z183_SALSN|nr:hypothetical protein SASPL_152383 [Salvia splendens]